MYPSAFSGGQPQAQSRQIVAPSFNPNAPLMPVQPARIVTPINKPISPAPGKRKAEEAAELARRIRGTESNGLRSVSLVPSARALLSPSISSSAAPRSVVHLTSSSSWSASLATPSKPVSPPPATITNASPAPRTQSAVSRSPAPHPKVTAAVVRTVAPVVATPTVVNSEQKQALVGKWVLVAGAGKGIGGAIAVALALEGANVALSAKTQAELEATAAACRAVGCQNVEMYANDLSQGKEVDSLAEQMIDKHGGCEVLVNNSGGFSPGNPLEGDPDAWMHMFNLNVHAGMRLTRRLAPKMAERQSGAIFDIGSVAALESMSGEYAAYAASKWAMRGWGASAYLTLRHKNVKCCRINPAYVNTGFAVEGQSELIPERMIQTSDIADYIRFVLHTSAGCVPEEITLRLGMSAFK